MGPGGLYGSLRKRLVAAIPHRRWFSGQQTGLTNQILPVTCLFHRLGKPQKLLGIDETLRERDLFRAGDFQALALLDDVDELRGFQQRFMGVARARL